MKKMILPALVVLALVTGCKKNDDAATGPDFATTENQAITDFVGKVVLPGYAELQVKATTLNTAVVNLDTNPTDGNLTAARLAWKDMRVTWERCEGFLFGPVEDSEVDPDTDTWPVNFNDLDALLASAQPLAPANIDTMSRSLKGYHPIEYILWGVNGTRTAASLTARQKEYMVSLSVHLKTKAEELYNSWISTGGNYQAKFLSAGTGSTLFVKKQNVFLAITDGIAGICEEVGGGKMLVPFNNMDPTTVESPFSGNSVIDFKNNMVGAFNAYQGKFNDDGVGLQDLVKLKNSSLNQQLVEKFNAAITSFDNITVPYEQAIISQRIQCQATMNAIDELAGLVDVNLRAFVVANITD